MTEFKTDVSRKYELTFTTDVEDNYRLMECLARQLIDKQEVVILRECEFEELCAHDADYANLRNVLVTFMQEVESAKDKPTYAQGYIRQLLTEALTKAKEALNDV